jgi:hypothetical protein
MPGAARSQHSKPRNAVRTGWFVREGRCRNKPPDTVGELKSAEICVPHMPSWKAKKLGKFSRENVLLEL